VEEKAPITSIRTIAAAYAPLLVLLLPLALLDGLLDGGLTLSYKFLVDTAIVPHDMQRLVIILAILVAGAVIGSALSVWRDRLYAGAVGRFLRDVRAMLFDRLQHLSARFRATHSASDIAARFSIDLAGLDAWLTSALNSLLLPVMNILTGIAVLFFLLPWQVAIAAVLVWPIVLIGPRLVAPHAAAAATQKRRDETALLSTVDESLATNVVVRAFNLENFTRGRFLARLTPLAASSVRATFYGLFAERITVITIYCVQILSVAAGATLAFRGQLSVGSFLAFLTAFWNLGWSTVVIARSAPTIVLADVAVRRLDELLGEPIDAADRSGRPELPALRTAIDFDRVAFAYPNSAPLLANLSFHIAQGESVAFVGPSGAGKSTIFNLIAGFNVPSAGCIRVDGLDVAQFDTRSLRAQIGFVFQESVLFNASLADNISLGASGVPRERIERAARGAHIHTTIAKLPAGYETLVGEGAAALSGGQRQRVGIARALFRNPTILLLDEPTSALDPESEDGVNATLAEAGKGCTTIAITHRLASVMHADRIFVVNGGGIEQSGTHGELLAAGGTYADLWRKQSGFAVSRDGAAARITADRLREIDLLHALDDDRLAALAAIFASVRVPAGETVIREGEPGDLFYIIARGQVTVSRADSVGVVIGIAKLDSGDEFGEVALLRDEPRNATVTTLVDSLFLTLSRDQFRDFLENNADVRDQLVAIAAARGATATGVGNEGIGVKDRD
jgi:ATP-binding cassette subfamily B protein